MAHLGYAASLLALVLALYASVAAWVGGRRRLSELVMSARNAVLAVAGLLTLAVALEVLLLLSGDFRTLYVAQVTNRAMPPLFKLTALWGSQAGSLLFWSWLMSLFTAAAVLRQWDRMRLLMPYVITVTQITLSFFLSLISGGWALLAAPLQALGLTHASQLLADMAYTNPFFQLDFTPADGTGLNPLLRHWGMILHPPALYLGFVGFVIPFAFAIAALITRQTGDMWIRTVRRWTLVAWLSLSMGLLLGMWWAYGVLGWGGYWGWDPVENAALMPWLTGTAFLHSVMIQEKRGMFKVWNMVLIILTYGLVIFGTFLTRSGVVSSVHTFAQSGIGPLYLIFVAITVIYSVVLLFDRLDCLRSENELDSILSREAFFLFNNLLFLAVFFVTFWGTLFPVVSELFGGQKAIVGPPFFNRVNGPLLAALVLLMGIAPLMPWRRASRQKLARLLLWPLVAALVTTAGLFSLGLRAFAILPGTQARVLPTSLFYGILAFAATIIVQEFGRGMRVRHHATGEGYARALCHLVGRNRRRYGGYLVHLGVIMIALGVIGTSFFEVETQQNLAVGESFAITSPFTGTYTLTYQGLGLRPAPADIRRTSATLFVSRDGQPAGGLYPTHDYFIPQRQPMTIPAMRHSLLEDLYVIVAGWEDGGSRATFKAYVEPLVNWLWIGGIVFILGTGISAWPPPLQGSPASHRPSARPLGDHIARRQVAPKVEPKMLNTLEYQQPEHRSETPSRRVHHSSFTPSRRLGIIHHSAFCVHHSSFKVPPTGKGIVHRSAFIILSLVSCLFLFVCFAMPAFAQQPTADEINAVARKLTCPTCTGINVADCPTETCAQWRAKIGEMLAQGHSEQEILDYFAARYGDHVLQVPPARGFFQWLWLLPMAATVLGLALLAYLLRSWSRQPALAPTEVEDQAVEDEYLRRVEQDLEEWTE